MDAPRGGADPSRRPEPSDGEYRVRVGGFEGPLDLLLHLVRINEVDIADIPIVEITSQYNAYLDLMRELNLEIAGEYVVMAATLMHIKSRMLLPVEAPPDGEAPGDPREELVQQLRDYQRFKQAAENLQAIDSVRSLVWTREGGPPPEFAGEELLVADLYDLITAFRRLLGRLDEDTRLRMRRDDVSVADKIGWLTDLLEGSGPLDLLAVLAAIPDRLHRIAAFLAVLEMMRLRLVVTFQREILGGIWIARREDLAPAGEASEEQPPGDGGEGPASGGERGRES